MSFSAGHKAESKEQLMGAQCQETHGGCVHPLYTVDRNVNTQSAVNCSAGLQWNSQWGTLYCSLQDYRISAWLGGERSAQLSGIAVDVINVTGCIAMDLVLLSDKILMKFGVAGWEIRNAS